MFCMDLGKILGKEAPQVEILGATYLIGELTQAISVTFPVMAQNGMKAEVLLSEFNEDAAYERFYLAKRRLWLCGIKLDYKDGIATIITMSDLKAYCEQGTDLVSRTLEIMECDVTGIEGRLIEESREMLRLLPNVKRALGVEPAVQKSQTARILYNPDYRFGRN